MASVPVDAQSYGGDGVAVSGRTGVECLEACVEKSSPSLREDQNRKDDEQPEFEYEETIPVASYIPPPIRYEIYDSELQMPDIMQLMKTALSEPYSIYTYRYFIHNWPQLCIMAQAGLEMVGAIVCKLEMHHYTTRRGYIAMLAVHTDYRKRRIGSSLVKRTILQMVNEGCDEVVLETEVTNRAALSLYENLGFVRDKYLHQYYLNGVDAYRLKLWLTDPLNSSHYLQQ